MSASCKRIGYIHITDTFIVRKISELDKFFFFNFSEDSLLDYDFTLTFVLEK